MTYFYAVLCCKEVQMKNYGLLGYPLGHSLSPFIHRCLFEAAGNNSSYELFEINENNLDEQINSLMKLQGFNVTIPHKINIIKYLDDLDDKAALFGAVNTVKTGEKIVGYNTDCSGFLRALDSAGIDFSGNVLLCGTGGVARMIAFEAVLHGCDLTVAYRLSSVDKALKIQAEIKEKLGKDIHIKEYKDIEQGWSLIVNGTSAGMYPNVNNSPLSQNIVSSADAVYDVIYNPAETLFLRYAREAGVKHSNGLSMLVWQAAVAQEIWTGGTFSPSEVEDVIKKTEKELLKR